jgi:hypothetical protein
MTKKTKAQIIFLRALHEGDVDKCRELAEQSGFNFHERDMVSL